MWLSRETTFRAHKPEIPITQGGILRDHCQWFKAALERVSSVHVCHCASDEMVVSVCLSCLGCGFCNRGPESPIRRLSCGHRLRFHSSDPIPCSQGKLLFSPASSTSGACFSSDHWGFDGGGSSGVHGACLCVPVQDKRDGYSDLPLCAHLRVGVLCVVFFTLCSKLSHFRAVRRIVLTLVGGSLLEFLATIPSHLAVAKHPGCCLGRWPVMCLAGGLGVMFWAFGPGIVLLFMYEARRRLVGHCPGCACNLYGLQLLQCPECCRHFTLKEVRMAFGHSGLEVDESGRAKWIRYRRWTGSDCYRLSPPA